MATNDDRGSAARRLHGSLSGRRPLRATDRGSFQDGAAVARSVHLPGRVDAAGVAG
jgi:hypothetical protein